MALKLLARMWERIDLARNESDAALFHDLMYGGELVLKLIVAGLVAAIQEERERHRYRQLHRLVRAPGLRDWCYVADQVLLGLPAKHLQPATEEEQRDLTRKCGPGAWQHEAVVLLHQCLETLCPGRERLADRFDGRRWLDLFAQLRNKKHHGAPPSGLCAALCGPLERSLRLVGDHFALFRRPWAYLHRHLSGEYQITPLSDDASAFDPYRAGPAVGLPDGVYVHFDRPAHVELVTATPDAADFFVPNGAFTDKKFELLSYLTNQRVPGDSRPYLTPTESLPTSETQPLSELRVQGECFGNLPPTRPGYVYRHGLEEKLLAQLTDDHHPIVTLVGRGGIGKTSLALSVLHRIAGGKRFDVLLWFSARDIDLLAEGPKPVRPHVLTERDIAEEFVRLLKLSAEGARPTQQFADALSRSPVGPMLLVFDNFETVRHPGELFTWLDTYHRLPNKVLITTRFRDFKGDYPVEVPGMTEGECDELIDSHARALGIKPLITPRYRRRLYQESEGHPYVVKVLLGEVAKSGRTDRVERIIADKEDILIALFERTYANLTPVARRVYLTLCAWRSLVPQLALEAVLLRPANERMAVEDAIDELVRSSLVEHQLGGPNADVFLSVPLSAWMFGKRKLQVNPYKAAIEADLQLLRAFGPGRKEDLDQGAGPRVESLFRMVATKVSLDEATLESYLPLLEYVAGAHPPAWLLLADLYEGLDAARGRERAADALRRHVEALMGEGVAPGVWQRLADLCRRQGDRSGEASALVELCRLPETELPVLTATARRLDALVDVGDAPWDADEKRIWMRQLVEVIEQRMAGAGAADCAVLSRLYWRLGERGPAERWMQAGLERDANDGLCQKMKSLLRG